MPDIGEYYTIPVILSFEGAAAKANQQLSRVFAGVGRKGGQTVAKDFASGMRSAERAVQTSAERMAKSQDKVKDALGRVRVEKARLDQVMSSGKEAQKVAATERLAAAERKHAAAIRESASAARQYKSAEAAQQAAQKGGGPLGGGGAGLFGAGAVAGAARLATGAGATVGKAFLGGFAGVGVAMSIKDLVGSGFDIIEQSFKTGIAFQSQLNQFKGVTRASKTEMMQMGAQARALGADTQLAGTTASDAAGAMTELAKAGFTTSQAMQAARGTLQLATAAQISAADAALYQSSAINTFQLQASDATRVADDLASAANASSIEIPDLALAMQQGGSVAHGFGMSLEDTIATLATFAQLGVRGSDAGTLLKTSLLSTLDPTEKQTTAMDELNLRLTDANGNFVGYREMMNQLSDAAGRMTQEQFNSAAATIFGTDAVRASMFAAHGAVPIWDQMRAAQTRSGAASEMAAAQMQGLPGVVEALSNTWESTKLTIFDSVDGIAQAMGTGLVGSLQGVTNWMHEHQDDITRFFSGIADFALAATQDTIHSVGMMADGIADITNVIGDTVGGTIKALAWLQRQLGHEDTARQMEAQAESMFGLADGLHRFADGALKAGDNVGTFRDRMRAAAEQTAQSQELTEALGGALADIPPGKNITIQSNDPAVKQRLTDLGFQVKELPDGKIEIIPQTQRATDIANNWRKQQTDSPVDIKLQPKLPPASDFLPTYRDWLAGITAGAPGPTVPAPGGGGPGAPPVLGGSAGGTPPSGGAGSLILPPGFSGGGGRAFMGGAMPPSKAPAGVSQANYNAMWQAFQAAGFPAGQWQDLVNIEMREAGFRTDARNPSGAFGMMQALGHENDQYRAAYSSDPYQQAATMMQYIKDRYGDPAKAWAHWQANGNYQRGGPINGAGGVDRVPIMATSGEFMVNREDSARHRGLLELINAGGLNFADGGVIPEISSVEQIAAAFGLKLTSGRRSEPGSYHNLGEAGDFSDGDKTPQELAFAQYMFQNYGSSLAELIHDQPGWAHNIKDGKDVGAFGNVYTMGQAGYHGDHVHIAIKPTGGAGIAPGTAQLPGAAGGTVPTPGGLNLGGTQSYGYSGGIPAGATPGTSPTGETGYYLPDQQQIADAQENLRAQEADLAIQQQQVNELKADATQSQRMAAEEQVRKAQADVDKAKRDLADAQRGEFHQGDTTDSQGMKTQGIDPGLAKLAELPKMALSGAMETLGFGSWLPDFTQLPIMKSLAAGWDAFGPVMQGALEGKLGIQQPGWQPGMPIPDTAGAPGPFGIPNVPAPPMPPEGVHTGTGAAPGPQVTMNVDQSQNFNNSPLGWNPAEVNQQRDKDIWRRALPRVPLMSG